MKNSDEQTEKKLPKGYTPPKGRPTPKRNEVERAHGVRRGPVTAPETRAEARKRRKELKNSMSKEEYKKLKAKERQEAANRRREIQDAIDRGDQRYLLERDKGEVKAYVRDWVDARRFINNLVMPAAMILLVLMLVSQAQPAIAGPMSIFALVMIAAFAIEGIILGSRVNKAVKQKFPSTTETGFGLGFYAYSRANQPRRWRSPKPRVELGAKV